MAQPQLREDQWERLYPVLRGCRGIYVGQEAATRRFVEAVVWMARAGCAWRLVPDAFGSWNSLYKRFARWQEKGVWQALMDHLAADADLEWLILDSTVVRAHACAAGAKKAKASRRSAARAAASPASCTPPATPSATLWPSG
jgi:transposase